MTEQNSKTSKHEKKKKKNTPNEGVFWVFFINKKEIEILTFFWPAD